MRSRGRFVLSDPVAPHDLPPHLVADDRLRAMCLSGAITYDQYVERLVGVGFGTIEVRARRPYRVLDRRRFGVERDIVLESLEVAAPKGYGNRTYKPIEPAPGRYVKAKA